MMELYHILCCILALNNVKATRAAESFKDQLCTDPRTMQKHAAYTEWADAYSCTRHRCQPGGRNLAIYTVGCKRVEAPESAIECEEVVEDTNMQFPYCCTRLRCLVVVQGEVWTRVLGQPWETLPAAPWSHMYKMKKPPPGDTSLFSKPPGEGPVYELSTEKERDAKKTPRSGNKSVTEAADCDEAKAPAQMGPDTVIAMSASNDKIIGKNNKGPPEQTKRPFKKDGRLRKRHRRGRKGNAASKDNFYKENQQIEPRAQDLEEPEDPEETEEPAITEKMFQKSNNQQVSWTEIPQNQWEEHEPTHTDSETKEHQRSGYPAVAEVQKEKPGNLQALADAIGTRMRDIKSAVQRMNEKAQQAKPWDESSVEKEEENHETSEGHKPQPQPREGKTKSPNPDGEYYIRFYEHGSKYLHGTVDATTEKPLFIEDNQNGYFSDASNTIRRASLHKEPPIYMAPVENRRNVPSAPEPTDESETTRPHSHKKNRSKSTHHKKHHGKRKRYNRLNSVELEMNTESLEDSNPDGKE